MESVVSNRYTANHRLHLHFENFADAFSDFWVPFLSERRCATVQCSSGTRNIGHDFAKEKLKQVRGLSS